MFEFVGFLLIFFGISFVFSILGRSGGTLYIPVLFWLGMNLASEAITIALFLCFVTSFFAAVVYGFKGLIRWKVALPLGGAMICFAPIGSFFSFNLPEEVLLIVFAFFTIFSVVPMLREKGSDGGSGSTSRSLGVGLSGGSILGFFAGFIGRGGGSFIVPLLYWLGYKAKGAAAISAFSVACATGASFISHILISSGQIEWKLLILLAIAVFSGSQIGSRFMVEKLKPIHIRAIFVAMNLSIGILLIVKDVILA